MNKYILIAIGAVVVIGGLFFVTHKNITPGSGQVACTMEAKTCPDGSSVGRVGPSCEFAPCPVATTTYTGSSANIKVTKQEDVGLLIGQVTTSPTCPVERMPPDPACAPRPLSSIMTISSAGTDLQVHTDTNGKFYVPLPTGTYQVFIELNSLYPHCPNETVVIKANATSTLNISCDTGIR